MGHRLHHAVVGAEGAFHDVLAVARGGDGADLDAGVLFVDIQQQAADDGDGVAAVGLVAGVQKLVPPVDDRRLHRGGAGVDADVHRPAARGVRHPGHGSFGVAGAEFLVLLPVFEQGRVKGVAGAGAVFVEAGGHVGQGQLLIRIEGRAQGHIVQAVFRAGADHAQGLVEAFFQLGQEGEGAAQIEHAALDASALGQAGDGLVHHRAEDAGRHVAHGRALVEQGLDVAFGEHAAAAGDGVRLFRVARGLVHLVGRHFQQRGHLVDKRAGAAGAAAVHAHLGAAGEEEDLRVLAAQLDDHVGVRRVGFGGHPGGEHLLHKGHAAGPGQAHTCRPGDGQQRRPALRYLFVQAGQHFGGLFHDVGKVPLVQFISKVSPVVQHRTFDGGGPDIQADAHRRHPFPFAAAVKHCYTIHIVPQFDEKAMDILDISTIFHL